MVITAGYQLEGLLPSIGLEVGFQVFGVKGVGGRVGWLLDMVEEGIGCQIWWKSIDC